MTTEWKGQRYWKNRPLDERLKNLKIPKRYENLTLASYDKSIGDVDVHYAVTTWLKMRNKTL